ncbi:tripartite tricarboxylate transporter permease [Candidatus Woesearchaeota archaeon]|nr:tripartite tricarboxylate transporter permease [Candidatus Woesearchaeota archaeon]
MVLSLFLAIILGCIAGTISGLIPGLHINLVAAFLLSSSQTLTKFISMGELSAFIIAMGITHTFLDALPSIFLGAPDADMAMGVLPGHKMLLEGKGYQAVRLTIVGSLLGLLGTLLFIFMALPLIPLVYPFIESHLSSILIVVVLFLLLKEKTLRKKLWAFFVFLFSGLLGILTFAIPNVNQPLFPLLSGIFGISTLVLALKENTSLPKQDFAAKVRVPWLTQAKAVLAAVISGSFSGLLPGLGSAQAAVIASQVVRNLGNYGFLIMVGGINTVNFTFSIASLFALQRARNGAVVVILELLENITYGQMVFFLGVALAAGSIAAILAIVLAKIFVQLIQKLNYRKLCITVMAFVTLAVFLISGPLGLLILITSTCLGMISPLVGIKRSTAMGCLLLPVILFFLL